MSVGIKMVGDWKKEIERPLGLALAASVEICGRTMAEACKHAIILMAQAAKNLTPKAPLKRPVEKSAANNEFVRVYKKNGGESRVFRFMFKEQHKRGGGAGVATLKGTWAQAQRIKNRGLAARSWMWGLKALGGPVGGRVIPGVAYVKSIISDTHAGYILRDAIRYLVGILPPGWEAMVQASAGNRIMHQAKAKLEREWKSAMGRSFRGGRAVVGGIGRYFLRM